MADLADGDSVQMQGSGATPYTLRNVGGVYSCSCPAWRNQSLAIEKRTCKHLRKLRGDEAEAKRCGDAAPAAKSATDKKAGDGPPLLLAQTWDSSTDLKDWWMSEKLDGVRAFWDGKRFLSRQGNLFHAPEWFLRDLPPTPLDGELWIDRKAFQRTVSIVRRQDKSDHWREVRFLVFDAPKQNGGFENRIEYLEDFFRSNKLKHADLHVHERCRGTSHLKQQLVKIEQMGGEGLMLRQPNSKYEIGRSWTLLKVKSFQDAEAIVLGHVDGKGRHKGRMGALICQLPDGTQFNVGTGFSDHQRDNPPAIGSEITFRYQELSDGGVPRFPSFVRAGSSGTKTSASQSKASSSTQVNKVSKTTGSGKSPSKPTKAARKITDKASASKKSQTKPASSAKQIAIKRYFEFSDSKSNKFWEIERKGCDVTVRFGRIGASGTQQLKTLTSEAAAKSHVQKLIDEKVAKGYVEET